MTDEKVVAIKAGRVKETKQPPSYGGIFGRIIAASIKVEPLIKREDHNEGWKFVSIDDYYEKAADILLKHGVSWSATEDFVGPVHPEYDAIGWRFSFSIYDIDGTFLPNFSKVTVPHDIEGPQTAGKVMSYAEKVFLRQLMKLVTGELDADSSPTKKGQPAKRDPTPPPLDLGDFLEELSKAKTSSEIDLLVEQNKRYIVNARKSDPDVYSKIAKMRDEKLKEFEEDGE